MQLALGRRHLPRLYHDVKLPPGNLVAAIERATGGEAEPELAAAIAEDCARTVDWLAAQGASFTSASPIGWHRWSPLPHGNARACCDQTVRLCSVFVVTCT